MTNFQPSHEKLPIPNASPSPLKIPRSKICADSGTSAGAHNKTHAEDSNARPKPIFSPRLVFRRHTAQGALEGGGSGEGEESLFSVGSSGVSGTIQEARSPRSPLAARLSHRVSDGTAR